MRSETSIDRFGRIVLPKAVRNQLGLEIGDSLLVYEQRGEIRLRPQRNNAALEERGGVLVHTGTAVGDVAAAEATSRQRRATQNSGRFRRK